jgi:hypothetical protein
LIYDRLSSLFDKLGIEHPENSCENGELMAYATAISQVQSEIEGYFTQLNANTTYGLGLSLYCELFNIDSTLSDDKKKELILQGLGMQYGDYQKGTFAQEVESLGSDFSAVVNDFNLIINGSVKGNHQLLSQLGKILVEYLPPCTTAQLSGDGLDFDFWDDTSFLFKDYDNLKLPFEVLDTLN